MRVRFENARSKIVQATDDELWWVDQYLAFEDTSRVFMRRHRGARGGDDRLHLLGGRVGRDGRPRVAV